MAESINELKSYTEYNVNTPTSVFTIGFQYDYNVDHVNVYVDDVEATAAGYTVQHDSQGTITLTPAVPSGVVRLSRETDIDTSAHTFSAGAKFTAGNMDENFRQVRHSQQEVRDVVLRTASEFDILDANATAALQAATAAVNTANSIDDKATTALSNSSTALSVANGVDAKATSALSSANTADAKATTALNTANTAQSVANGIDAKATQAQSDASAALSTVTTQKGAANGITPLGSNVKIDPMYLPTLIDTPLVPKATETALGVVKLVNSLNSTDTTQALTAAQGKALNDQSLGIGQSWVDVTSYRQKGVTYTNNTGKPIQLSIIVRDSGNTSGVTLKIGEVVVANLPDIAGGNSGYQQLTAIVPNGQTYQLYTSEILSYWAELR